MAARTSSTRTKEVSLRVQPLQAFCKGMRLKFSLMDEFTVWTMSLWSDFDDRWNVRMSTCTTMNQSGNHIRDCKMVEVLSRESSTQQLGVKPDKDYAEKWKRPHELWRCHVWCSHVLFGELFAHTGQRLGTEVKYCIVATENQAKKTFFIVL